jgi:hypothetical protein
MRLLGSCWHNDTYKLVTGLAQVRVILTGGVNVANITVAHTGIVW